MPDKSAIADNIEADVCIIGGGAAGFFCALTIADMHPGARILILEQGKEVLSKVRISGGGRCNVTHACYDVGELLTHYPRGRQELRGPFTRFGPADTMQWFAARGVPLKVEEDGRVFPRSDSSESIIRCFTQQSEKAGIRIWMKTKVTGIRFPDQPDGRFVIRTGEKTITSRFACLTTGSSHYIWQLLAEKGYTIVPPVPSLFTFNLPGHALNKMMGITVPCVRLTLPDAVVTTRGPLLITHWWLSGPAVLRASAFAARWLADAQYKARVEICWDETISVNDIEMLRHTLGKKKVAAQCPFNIPLRLWKWICEQAFSDQEKNWASLSKQESDALIRLLTRFQVNTQGKTTFKEEFVTAGGVDLKQIHFTSFQSKLHPGFYLAGEVLNIDAVTGGFNFQAAWTGGALAGVDIATALLQKY